MFAIRPWRWSPALIGHLLVLLLVLLLSACGGGGSGSNGCTTIDPNRDSSLPGCSTTTPPVVVPPVITPVLTMLLTDAGGNPTANISTDQPGSLLVRFDNGSKVAVANALLTFTTTDRTGVFVPASATAITDASGVARIMLPVGTVAGAYTATVTGVVDGKTATASVNYNVTLRAPGASSLALALNDINGVPTTLITPTRPGSLAATVRNTAGAVVPNTVVTFTTTDTSATLVPLTGTALTNAQGVAQVALPAGSLNGAFTATARATVDGVAVTASSSYTVTLPPPVTNPPVPPPSLLLTMTNAGGTATNSVAPDSPATLTALVRNTANVPVVNALVTFVSNDRTAILTPANGAALTDASGRASVILSAGTSPGGFSVIASSTVDTTTVAASANYAVTYPTLSLAVPAIAPASLAAGGTASVAVSVLNGGVPYLPPLSVSFSSPCATAGKARLVSPVTTVNGIASTSYTDLGCGTADVITASAAYNGAGLTTSGTLTVRLAAAGQLVFVSALPQNIALKGTGGAGRQETSTVTFKVLDGAGKPIGGQTVNFALNTTVGGLAVSPTSAVTASDGTVSTIVASGTINTPVRVTATLPGGAISTVSDQLVVSTGVPEQASFSLSALTRNIEGGSFNGCPAPNGTTLTARLADRFHNPAPDGTAVSFTAEGGSVDASCLTGLVSTTLTDGSVITQKGTPGECTVRYCAGSPRPADGRITVLAYALGEESYIDANGNNRYDAGEIFTDLGDPFRNDRAVTDANASGVDDAYVTGNAARASGEAFIDTNGNGTWDATGNASYNGVLRSNGAGSSDTVHIRQSMVMVLSNSTANISLLDQQVNNAPTIGTLALSQCATGTAFNNVTRTFRFAIRDNNPTVFATNRLSAHPGDAAWLFDRPGNPLPAGSIIRFSTSNGRLLSAESAVVQNTSSPDSSNWVYTVQMVSDAFQDQALNCSNTITGGALTISVTTPSGVVSSASYPVTD